MSGDDGVHLRHCNQGEYVGSCKYGELDTCPSLTRVELPDFGENKTTHGGVTLTCKNVAPGLTLHDLVMIHENAAAESKPGDCLSADPLKWPVVRGVDAVVTAIMKSLANSTTKL